MISGVMPKWRQYFYRFAGGFMGLLFAGLGLLGIRFPVPLAGSRPTKGLVITSLLFVAFSVCAIGGQFRYPRRLVTEFLYEGSSLRFRTLGLSRI